MNRQFEQLKDDITMKELALDKEHQEFQRLERERECLKVTTMFCPLSSVYLQV